MGRVRKNGQPAKRTLSRTKSENLDTWVSICKFASEYGPEETAKKYPGLLRDTITNYLRVYQRTETIRKFLPDGKDPVDFLRENGVSFDAVRTITGFTDDAQRDAVDAILQGGKVLRKRGIVWPDGRKRPIEDCRKSSRKKQPEKKAKLVPKPKTPSEELAELIAGAAGTFDASIERYVLDYPDAPKDAAITELQKAGEIINSWIERMRLNGE